MAPPKKSQDDFEGRFFDLLEGTIQGIDKKVDAVDATQKRQDKRISRIERRVFPDQPQTAQQLPQWWRDPNLIKLFTLIIAFAIIVAAIIAGLQGITLPGIFG